MHNIDWCGVVGLVVCVVATIVIFLVGAYIIF